MSPVIISILAPLFKRGGHFVASSLHFVAEGAKTELRLRVALSGSCYAETGKSRGFTRSGALGQPGEGHDLAGGVLCVISRR